MARITPDFSEAVEVSNEKMPAGKWSARITGAEAMTSKAGNEMVKVECTIFGAEGDLERYNNWKLNTYAVASGKGAARLKEIIKATGLDEKGFDTEDLLGKEVQISTVLSPGQDGTPRPEIKAVTALV